MNHETFQNDPYAQKLGFHLREVEPGYAVIETTAREDVLNFGGIVHGGFLFSLADYAFAVASNSHGVFAVATNVSIQFLAAAQPGDKLVAKAKETHCTKRVGYYEMSVETEHGKPIAKCLGTVHRTGRFLPGFESTGRE